MLNNILDYWYAQEFFSPSWPINTKKDCDLTKNNLPWSVPQTNSKIRLSYDVYFGKITVARLIEWLLTELKLTSSDDAVEKDNTITCLFAIKIDENGNYVPDSFAVSSLVWAICKLVSANSLNSDLNHRHLDKLQYEINNMLIERQDEAEDFKISSSFLHELFLHVCDQVHLPIILCHYAVWSKCKKDYANQAGDFPALNPSTELMQSFYLSDIQKAQKAPTDSIVRYVTGMLESDTHNNRVHIDSDISQMQYWLDAEAFPLGAWPSTYSPSLMQQLGINLAISDNQKVFSVNGPPGTGKTTLLKEVVVSNVVQRAVVMSRYNRPSDAFQKEAFQNPIDIYNQSFYKINRELSAFGMIVASNNNAAVENISIELPKAIKEDRTGHFSSANAKNADRTYFADIASNLIEKPAWGLISARLGKKKNLSKLKDRLWWADDKATLKEYYENSAPSWAEARKAFQVALDAVVLERKKIADAQAALTKMHTAEKALLSAHSDEVKAKQIYAEQENRLNNELLRLKQLETSLQAEDENVARLENRISFLKRLFHKWFKNDPIIAEWQAAQKQTAYLEVERAQQQRKCISARNEKNTAERELTLSVANTKQAKEILDSTRQLVETYHAVFTHNWADTEFWRDIPNNEASQSACPWTTPEYDKLREELFYQALMLHKAFILSSNEIKQNLNRLFAVWDGKITGIDRNKAYGHLLNTLLLVVPVVSTTFASVQSFLDGIGAEDLGILIVDEAGQATPQSALGALWRTRKAIIVGDPLQVEPITTIPKELRRRFANEYNIPPTYRLPELSVQMLADSINLYGGTRTLEGNNLWLGCPLVTHRRCLNPMFSISNAVAYNNRMFYKTSDPKPDMPFVLKKSVWFDCRGSEKGNKNHTVPEQIELVGKIFEKAVAVYSGLPDLYIISPFTTVVHALTEPLRKIISQKLPHMEGEEINDWIDKHCGTVHTFQGKEASEVIFVLGCDAQGGRSAAQWVGQKPNIVNVAVSRAKYRLGVIGDYELWKHIPYVQKICNHLQIVTSYDSNSI